MSNFRALSALGVDDYLKNTGAGSDADPHRPVVIGEGFSVQVDFLVDAGAYSIGDALAAMGTFAGMSYAAGKHGVITSIVLAPNGAMPAIPFNLWILNADLATPIAKNGVFTYVAADAPKILGIIKIEAPDYVPSQNSWNVASLEGRARDYQTVATSLYVYLVCTEATAPVATHVYLTLNGVWLD